MRHVLMLALFAGLCGSPLLAADHTKEPLPEVKKQVESKKARLVDVRSEDEWKAGHLDGAVFLPVTELEKGIAPEALAKRLPKDRPVYVHCAAGFRALKAANLLEKQGYDVRPLKPGYDDLLEAGFPKAQ